MSYAVTFDGVTIQNPAPLSPKQTADSFDITITGITTSKTDVDNLVAKAGKSTKYILKSGKVRIQTFGTKGTLVIDGTSYTKCVIMEPIAVAEIGNVNQQKWQYTVMFSQETA
jgi:hypothetical protein